MKCKYVGLLWKRSDILPAINSQDLSYLLIPFWWPSPCGPGYWQSWQFSKAICLRALREPDSAAAIRSWKNDSRLAARRAGGRIGFWFGWIEVCFWVESSPECEEVPTSSVTSRSRASGDAVGRHGLQIGWRPSMAELTLDVADTGVSTLPRRRRV